MLGFCGFQDCCARLCCARPCCARPCATLPGQVLVGFSSAEVLLCLPHRTDVPSSTVHYRNWNPPLLGNLPEDFLRILPQQTAPAGTQVSLATPSSLLCRVAWAPSQSSASLSLQHQHPGYQGWTNLKV